MARRLDRLEELLPLSAPLPSGEVRRDRGEVRRDCGEMQRDCGEMRRDSGEAGEGGGGDGGGGEGGGHAALLEGGALAGAARAESVEVVEPIEASAPGARQPEVAPEIAPRSPEIAPEGAPAEAVGVAAPVPRLRQQAAPDRHTLLSRNFILRQLPFWAAGA